MKKNVLRIIALGMSAVIWTALLGCDNSSGGGSSGVKMDSAAEVSVQKYASGNVIKNKVVQLTDSADVYYEYFTFTSDSAGTYSLYKYESNAYAKQTTNPVGGGSLPEAFTYDAKTGKISATAGSVTYSVYLVDSKKDGEEVKCIAEEVLSSDDSTLFAKWTGTKAGSYTFYEDASCVYQNGTSNSAVYSFENQDGWILVDYAVPFLWTKLNGTKSLLYNVYETTRETVTEAGRALSTNEVSLVSNRFMLFGSAK